MWCRRPSQPSRPRRHPDRRQPDAAIGPDLASDEAVARRHPLVIDAAKRIVIPASSTPHPLQRKLLPGLLDACARSVDPSRISAVRSEAAARARPLSAHHAARGGVPALRHHHGAGRSHQPPRGTGRFDGCAAAYRDIGLRAAITTSMSDRPFSRAAVVDELMIPHQGGARDPAIPRQRPARDVRAQLARWHDTSNGRIRAILDP